MRSFWKNHIHFRWLSIMKTHSTDSRQTARQWYEDSLFRTLIVLSISHTRSIDRTHFRCILSETLPSNWEIRELLTDWNRLEFHNRQSAAMTKNVILTDSNSVFNCCNCWRFNLVKSICSTSGRLLFLSAIMLFYQKLSICRRINKFFFLISN